MRICHFTNTFLPHIGGVARAVETLLLDQLKANHKVLVVAPEFEEKTAPKRIEKYVDRIISITHFNDTDFSFRIPMAATFSDTLAAFKADIIHTHHPFLLGDTALREASFRDIPIVFTHHTLYEQYTHYLPVDWAKSGRLAADLATRFANRTSAVIAPSESIRQLIQSRGVKVPVHVVPTGIETSKFQDGNREQARKKWAIPSRAFLMGHVGRLAPEKNLQFLVQAMGRALKKSPNSYAIIVGEGPEKTNMQEYFQSLGVANRTIFTGALSGKPLLNAYKAMDLFAFASQSETQGLVVNEAMASGTVVVALDGPGVREVVQDKTNGRLLPATTTPEGFSRVIKNICDDAQLRKRLRQNALRSAKKVDRTKTSQNILHIYSQTINTYNTTKSDDDVLGILHPIINRMATEGHMIADKAIALIDSITADEPLRGNS